MFEIVECFLLVEYDLEFGLVMWVWPFPVFSEESVWGFDYGVCCCCGRSQEHRHGVEDRRGVMAEIATGK